MDATNEESNSFSTILLVCRGISHTKLGVLVFDVFLDGPKCCSPKSKQSSDWPTALAIGILTFEKRFLKTLLSFQNAAFIAMNKFRGFSPQFGEMGGREPFPFPQAETKGGYLFEERIDLEGPNAPKEEKVWMGPDSLNLLFLPPLPKSASFTDSGYGELNFDEANKYCLALNTENSQREQVRISLHKLHGHYRLKWLLNELLNHDINQKEFLDYYLKIRQKVKIHGYYLPPIAELMMLGELSGGIHSLWSSSDHPHRYNAGQALDFSGRRVEVDFSNKRVERNVRCVFSR